MTRTVDEKRAAFRALHEERCFVLPNPWDLGSARLLQDLGFAALASTSSGFAWTFGRPDYATTRDGVLAHLATLCEGVDVPVNADFEGGFASTPEGVATNVALAVKTGVAGLSIEDRDESGAALYGQAEAIERLRAARTAIDGAGGGVMLVARTEGLLLNADAVTPAIDRLVAFAEAGADCLYAPGVQRRQDIASMVRAVAPKPVNVLVMSPDQRVAELAELGVRRISVGGSLAAVAWGAALAAAEQMRQGSFAGLAARAPSGTLNATFSRFV